jgi:3',5'-nucleoside bisphosphate phosphatase
MGGGVPRNDAVDLHLHTIYSDGSWRPKELFAYLAAEGFGIVSVTDHDTLAHLNELRLLGETHRIRVLGGVEVTSRWRGKIAHVLCYATDFIGDGLAGLLEETVRDMGRNTAAVYTELERRGYRFPRRDEILAAEGGEPRRPIDNARLLVEHGHADTLGEALDIVRDAGYVVAAAPIQRVVELAHQSGAVAILAHPGRGDGEEIHRYDPATILPELLDDVPLDGLEVHYPTHSPEQTAAYQQLATRRGLVVSTGSDSHGPNSRLPIHYQVRQCAELLARCGLLP